MIYKINNREVNGTTWLNSTEDGIYQLCDDREGLIQEVHRFNGQRNGVEKIYHLDGDPLRETTWVNNKRHGLQRWYDENSPGYIFVNDENIGPLKEVLKEKGKLWILIVFGPEVLKEVLELVNDL